ncbi:MAG: hypothetical protein JXB49_30050 [Bacteroidales bacterium]|nr:hypothetical protein [Bacteroidales bacterium]
MKGLIFEALADHMSERLNRPVIEPVSIQKVWLPTTSYWHTLLDLSDTGVANSSDPPDVNSDIFCGELEMLNSTWITESFKPYEILTPKIAVVDPFGKGSQLYRNWSYNDGKYIFKGVFGFVAIDSVPDHHMLFEFKGYLLKCI